MRSLPIQKKLEHQVLRIMTGRGASPLFSPATGLLAVSWLYGACMRARRIFYEQGVFASHRLPSFVISVGNLCLGGAGKTPMVLHLGRQVRDMGYSVAVVSRGYKGLHESKGAVVSDGRKILCDARHAGDEPYLTANLLGGVPVAVGKDRVAAGRTVVNRFHPQVLILDDGFQHLRLQRDLNLLLLDCRHPFGNAFVLPRGTLREPKAALSRADALILTRCDIPGRTDNPELAKTLASSRPVYRTAHRSTLRVVLPAGQMPVQTLSGGPVAELGTMVDGKRVFVFSGLAQNQAFQDSVRILGANVTGSLGFGDHHPYTAGDTRRIIRAALSAGSDYLVTTDKDYVRLPSRIRFPLTLVVLGIDIDFGGDRERWQRFIARQVEKGVGARDD